MADHNHVRTISCGSLQDLIGWMPDEHMSLECHIALLCLTSQAVEQFFVVARGQFNGRLCLDLCRRLWWAGHRDDGQPGAGQRSQVQRIFERRFGVAGPIVTDQNVRGNHHPSRSPTATACGIAPIGEGASAFGKRYRGTKKALATNVGTTALPITVAMRYEYWDWSMI